MIFLKFVIFLERCFMSRWTLRNGLRWLFLFNSESRRWFIRVILKLTRTWIWHSDLWQQFLWLKIWGEGWSSRWTFLGSLSQFTRKSILQEIAMWSLFFYFLHFCLLLFFWGHFWCLFNFWLRNSTGAARSIQSFHWYFLLDHRLVLWKLFWS